MTLGVWLRGRARHMRSIGLCIAISLACPFGAQAQNDPDSLRAEAFEAAQLAVSSGAADALAKMSARFAIGGDAIGQLAQSREALVARKAVLERQIGALYGGAATAAAQGSLQAQLNATTDDLARLDNTIAEEFPAYAELTNPRAVALKEVQGLLAPNEALLFVLVNADATYVWGVSNGTVAWARADDLGEAALRAKVSDLRLSMHAGSIEDPARGLSRMGRPTAAAGFDRETAYELYRKLILPVEGALAGKTTLITVTTGPLMSLPLAVLVASPAAKPGGSAAAVEDGAWLGDRYAMASLPAVSSLKALRCYLAPRPQDRPKACLQQKYKAVSQRRAGAAPLVGYGAPRLNGAPAELQDGMAPARDAPPASELFSGALADPDKLRALPYLPGAERELTALQARYPTGVVRTLDLATETNLKTVDHDALQSARYVIFSTHGVLAGSANLLGVDGKRELAEPGLVLTPPAAPTELDDGYLSASEAAQLSLTADFVVLSACNTAAAGGGPGDEGLSGLAKAFFYAGARSVLVSHWEVSDAATTELITSTFSNLEARSVSGRAIALQAAMKKVRAEPGFSNPYFWAAFELVGEAER